MRTYVAKKARTFRSWILGEARSEIRGWQQLDWLIRELAEPVAATNMAVQPATLAWIINDIRINQRKCIVELGAGFSTQLIAKCLQKCYSPADRPLFFSIEEDKQWIEYLKHLLTANDLQDCVRFVHAPRTDYASGSWFRESDITTALGDRKPDLLLVDGPSILLREQAEDRLRAHAFFASRMAEAYTVFIDDAERPAERKLLQQWAKSEGLPFDTMNAYLGVITRGNHYVSRPF